jgi:hypothetical protein
LPRIAQTMMQLRGADAAHLARVNRINACAALPRLARLLEHDPGGATS